MLAVIETHPVQYRAPVYRVLQESHGVDVTAIYRSDFSVTGYEDREFKCTFSWDSDLLCGYNSVFLSENRMDGGVSRKRRSPFGLRDALEAASPSAILLVGYRPNFYMAGYWQARRLGLPVLFRGETTDHARKRGFLRKTARTCALRRLYNGCARVLYIGKRSREHFLRIGVPERKLVFSPYCVALEHLQADEWSRGGLRELTRQKLGVSDGRRVLLFSGKLVPGKAPGLLIEAVRQLPEKLRRWMTVVFLGSGELEGRLMASARRLPSVDVRFVGFKNQTDLSPYYHAADLLVLPSYSETWGLVVNEGLHHGLPCVVSEAVGCADDLVKPGVSGERFETGLTSSLAEALLRAESLIGRVDVRRQCRALVSRYSVDEAAAGIARAYRTVAPS